MQTYISQPIEKIFSAIGYKKIALTKPPTPDMGDIAVPCFEFAKEQKKNPAELAHEISAALGVGLDREVFVSVDAIGPYINIVFNPTYIADSVLAKIEKTGREYGAQKQKNVHTIMVEYPSNNTHKEFHIGHLRNVCIGNSLCALTKKMGHTVKPVNYLNDFGAHVAKCLWWITTHTSIDDAPENKQKWLGEMYAASSKYLNENPDSKKQVSDVLQKLESKDPEITKLFEKTRTWSTDKFAEIFKELDVHHEEVFFESDIKSRGHKLVDSMLKDGIAEVGERGAFIVDLEKYNLDIALVRKSDGTGVYATSDLALAEKKFADANIDESIVITGNEQNFYFKQLFKIFELLGYTQKNTHISYGLIKLAEGKMSSRAGTVILYEDLRDEIFEHFLHETSARHADWHDDEVRKTALVLTQAVLKFSLLKYEAKKDIVFNFEEVVSMEGYSAPYVLYSIARINSILENVGIKKTPALKSIDTTCYTSAEAKQLLLLLAAYPDEIAKAYEQYNPAVLTRYCFDVASVINSYYAVHSVLHAKSTEAQKAHAYVLMVAKDVLTNALDVLTITSVEKM